MGNSNSPVNALRWHIAMLSLLALMAFLSDAAASSPQKIALLVGVSDYFDKHMDDLTYAENDVTAVAMQLRSIGFEVTQVIGKQASRSELRERVDHFLEQTTELDSDSIVFIMFSGHGQQLRVVDRTDDRISSKEIPFFCPYDAIPVDPAEQSLRGKSASDIESQYKLLSLNKLFADIDRKSNSLQNLIVIDACRSNPAKGKAPGITGAVAEQIPRGISILFAAKSGQKSWESSVPEIKNGVLTHYLLKGLAGEAKNRRNEITWSRLVSYVQEEVEYEGWKLAGGKMHQQNPHAIINHDQTVRLADHLFVVPRYDNPDNIPGFQWKVPVGMNGGHPRLSVTQDAVYVASNDHANVRDLPLDQRPKGQPWKDAGTLSSFDVKSGRLSWQLVVDKHELGNAVDWHGIGIVSSPCIEGNRLWVISNRNEIICLDTEGFRDGENDGPVKNEPNQQSIDADIVWSVDMIQQYGAVPLRKAYGDPVIHGDLLIVPTSNGVDDKTHTKAADAPSLIALNKTNGQLSWSMKPKYPIFQGSYSSPTIATVAGEKLLLFPAGDGWLYALNPENGKPIWWFDLNHKNVSTDRYGNYERLYGSHAPVVKDGKVLVALGLGDDGFEHTESRMWCIDASGRGDVSSEIGPVGKPGQPNPNSAAIWEFTGGYGEDSSPAPFFATLNAPKIVGSQVFVATATGFVHCIELQSGKERWHFDLLSSVYAPLVILADQLLVFDEDHKVTILPTDGTNPNEIKPHEIVFPEPVYSGVSPNQSRLYLSSDKYLYQMNPSTLIDEATIQSP